MAQQAQDGQLTAPTKRLRLGRLGHGNRWVRQVVGQLERSVWDALCEMDQMAGRTPTEAVSLARACAVQTAARYEQHALLCQRQLRVGSDKLTPEQHLAFSREIGRASDARDRALRTVGIDPQTLQSSQQRRPWEWCIDQTQQDGQQQAIGTQDDVSVTDETKAP